MATTQTQERMAGRGPHVEGEAHLVDGAGGERLPAGYDTFSLLENEAKELGVGPQHATAWIRNPAYWKQHESSDRVREFTRTHPGTELVRDKDGDLITQHDTILVKYPREQLEAEEKRARQAMEEWQADMENRQDPLASPEARKRLKEDRREEHRRSGLVGPLSPTSGMRYADARSRYSDEQVEAEEARLRRNARRVNGREDDSWQRLLDHAVGNAGRPAAPARRSTTVAMGDSGFGRNPNSPLAQAQARENKQQQQQAQRAGGGR